MAKKGKKGSKRRSGGRYVKRGASRKDHALPAATTIAALYTAGDVLFVKDAENAQTVFDSIMTPGERKRVPIRLYNIMKDPETYVPLGIGLVVDILKPKKASRIIRKMTKGRMA
jgi:hypothetical protein